MSTTTTQQQILTEWDKCKKRLLPAVLSDTLGCGQMVNGHMQTHQIPYTEEGFYRAVRDLMRQLPWDRKPAALIAIEKADAPALVENPRTLEEARLNLAKQHEQRDKVLAENAATEKLIEAAISAYFPVNRMGRPSLPKKEAEQARLRAYVKQEIARNADRKSILEQVNKEIERLYAEEAIANERL